MSRTQGQKHKNTILSGTVLCIDPSSGGTDRRGVKSSAGWAIFSKGQLHSSGEIQLDNGQEKPVRLRGILECLKRDFPETYDLLIVENIEGYRASKTLIQACGVYIAGIESSACFEMNVKTWQAIAKRLGGWEKSDEADAIYIGWAAVAFALGYNQKESEENREEVLKLVRERMK
jgi:hypothetical protein